MYFVCQSNHIAGLGVAVILVSCGKENERRIGEYHILLPHVRPCELLSQLFSVGIPEEVLTEEELRSHVQDFAKDRLQSHADERYLATHKTAAPLVALTEADISTIRRLRFAGMCERELSAIAVKTRCLELKTAIRQINQLPPISSQEF